MSVHLQSLPSPQIQHISQQPARDANFLSLKLLNKRARVRLSPGPLNLDVLPGRASLFAVSNSKGWFAAITQSSDTRRAIICSPLSELRDTFKQPPSPGVEELPFTPKRTVDIADAIPNTLAFAFDDTRLVVGLTQGSIAVFDTGALFTPGTNDVFPLHTFAPTSSPTAPRLLAANPANIPLIAILRERDPNTNTHLVEVLNVETMQLAAEWRSSNTPDTTPTAISWSPKGKQLAIGLQSGDIVTFDPHSPSSPKVIVPHPPFAAPQSIISTVWLSNPCFHAIFVPAHQDGPDIELSHYLLSIDQKSKSSTSIKIAPPCLPFPGLRPPSSFSLVLRNWEPAKFLLLIGDSASSDIGAITCTVDPLTKSDQWGLLSLDDTAQPTMPLDKETADTVLVGLELDLTASQSITHTDVSGAEVEVLPPPILYAYASDGTVLGWHLINPQGGVYPGMVHASASTEASMSSLGAPTEPMVVSRAPSTFGEPMATSTPTTTTGPTFAQPMGFGAPSFGQPLGFGQQSQTPTALPLSQNQSPPAFGQPSSFGKAPVFGQTSVLGAPQMSTPAPGGFAAYASAAMPKFGQTSFGFGSSAAPAAPPMIQQTPDESMMSEPSSGFGSMAISETDKSKLPFGGGGGGVFGQTATSPLPLPPDHPSNQPTAPSPATSPQSAFGSMIKPATGFGAFQQKQPQQLSTTGGEASKPAAAPTFGRSGFDTPTFGRSGFGSAPTFGQSSFGNVAPSVPATAPTNVSSGGFGAFAQGGPTSLSAAAGALTGAETGERAAKPSWASGGGSGVFGSTTPGSPFGSGSGVNTFGAGGSAFVSAISSPGPFSQAQGPSPTSFLSGGFGGGGGTTNAFGGLSFGQAANIADRNPVTPAAPEASNPISTLPFTSTTSPVPSSPIAPPAPLSPPAPSPPTPSSTGAFGASKAAAPTSSFLRPATGFGAFGATETSKSNSPFYNPRTNIDPKAPPGFATSVSSAAVSMSPIKTGSATPTFGSTSALGSFGSLAVGSPATPAVPVKTAAAPISGGFSAFSGSASGFGAFAGPRKSFGELLKTGGDPVAGTKTKDDVVAPAVNQTADEDKQIPPASAALKIPELDSAKNPDAAKAKTSLPPGSSASSHSPTPTKGKLPDRHDLTPKGKGVIPSFIPPSGAALRTSSRHGADSDSDDESATRGDQFPEDTIAALEPTANPQIPSEPSLGSLSLSLSSQTSSFVELSDGDQDAESDEEGDAERDAEGEDESSSEESEESDDSDGQHEEGKEEQASEGSLQADDTQDFLSETVPTDVSDEEESGKKYPAERNQKSRSQSTTPKPELPVIQVIPTVTGPEETPRPAPPAMVRGPSSTPPGTPTMQPSVSSSRTSTPLPSPSSSPVNSLGPWRPSNRPARSSPLASAPSQLEDESEESSRASASPSVSKTTASPQPTTQKLTAGALLKPVSKPEEPESESKLELPLPRAPSTGPRAAPLSLPWDFVALPSRVSATKSSPSTSPAPPPPTFAPTNSSGPFSFGLKKETANASVVAAKSVPALKLQPQSQLKTQQGDTSSTSSMVKAASMEDSIQTECTYLLTLLAEELETLRLLAQETSKRCAMLKSPVFGTKSKSDLADGSKWRPADIKQWGETLMSIVQDMSEAEEKRRVQMEEVKNLQTEMLKASTRKEEIVRFSRAKSDEELTKMLKVRSLGPEHLEMQGRLRRDIRAMRDRIQGLEDHLQASKKKLTQLKTGKPGFRAPSLDTISRTYRNIDLVISQQTSLIDALAARVSRLDLSSDLGRVSSARDPRLPDQPRKRREVTPAIATTTAAALNAERSAQKLKRALLAVRKEPVLNTTANSSALSLVVRPNALPASSASDDALLPSLPTLDWLSSIPGLELDDSTTSPFKARRGGGTKLHSKPIQIKKAAGTSLPPAPTFDWGPMPNLKPMATLSRDVRKQPVARPDSDLDIIWSSKGPGKSST